MINELSDRGLVLAATSIGDGVALACRSKDTSGRVVGTFSTGFYVQTETSLFAIGGPRIPAGPIHLVLEVTPPPTIDESIVHIEPDRLWLDNFSIELSTAIRHYPIKPTRSQIVSIASTLSSLDSMNSVPQDVIRVWASVRIAVEHADLHTARRLLEGLGSGLTPTGDDVLAGLLLYAHWVDPTSPVPTEVSLSAATTNLSRCFLSWAAIGQSIQPLHDLIDAANQLVSADNPVIALIASGRFEQSIVTVASIGGSSGKGMLAGLGLAASSWPVLE